MHNFFSSKQSPPVITRTDVEEVIRPLIDATTTTEIMCKENHSEKHEEAMETLAKLNQRLFKAIYPEQAPESPINTELNTDDNPGNR